MSLHIDDTEIGDSLTGTSGVEDLLTPATEAAAAEVAARVVSPGTGVSAGTLAASPPAGAALDAAAGGRSTELPIR
eukprot:CAMPEP_0195584324 /NCGR_PEP_ID=MMETSP0814-20130614/25720_1 /TAXON_ID=97485 /ORGANISM="Prymnesium parvum, Strain Texoma1" /LENGTH=75 /DNA_ID=CAMNT_0040722381 /DNA_START=148 /DNA_END=372 /DNA_ORIENTATION=-